MGVPLDSDCYRQTVTFRAIVLNSFMTLAPMFMGRTGCWRSPGMSNDVCGGFYSILRSHNMVRWLLDGGL